MTNSTHTTAQCQIDDEAQDDDLWLEIMSKHSELRNALAAYLSAHQRGENPPIDNLLTVAQLVLDLEVIERADEIAEEARDRAIDYRVDEYSGYLLSGEER